MGKVKEKNDKKLAKYLNKNKDKINVYFNQHINGTKNVCDKPQADKG